MQKVLWDRRLCLKILDQMNVPTPKRVIVNRDGGPTLKSAELAQHVKAMNGVSLKGAADGTGGGEPITRSVEMTDDNDTLVVDGQPFRKPFVEKPVDGEDHNIIIYFPNSHEGGGARRLFRKIGNKSSEFDPGLTVPRCITDQASTYIYERFLRTENAEDVKAYTVGPDYCHAETRKSPVVDGLVKRNTHGKEIRYVTQLNAQEKEMASRVSRGFGQRICGFDLLRANGQAYVIDVNGWSFVKDNERYYDECAGILKAIFSNEKQKRDNPLAEEPVSETTSETASGRDRASTSSHSHRSALKTIFKSPSMTRLSAHLPHSSKNNHTQGASSPRTSMMVPLSSPPSLERQPAIDSPLVAPPTLAVKAAETEDVLPPPAIPPALPAPEQITKDDIITVQAEKTEPAAPPPSSKHSWKLKGVVTVIRHADRTPKQKLKFTAHSQIFVDLLKGHHEVLLKGEAALSSVEAAVKMAQREGLEDKEKLRNLRNVLSKKKSHPATKVQIKPMFRKRKAEEVRPGSANSASRHPSQASIPKHAEAFSTNPMASPSAVSDSQWPEHLPSRSDSISGATFSRYAAAENDLIVDKLQLVLKWGGEPTHAARYQSQDLGSNMRDDFKLLNRKVLDDVRVFTSSEKRVKTTAQIWAAAFLGRDDIAEEYIQVRKDLLDDSNAAKDVMDTVKRKLKHLLREGNSVPEEFAWPDDVPEPYIVMQTVTELLNFHRKVMRHNFRKLSSGAAASLAALGGSPDGKDSPRKPEETVNVATIQSRWCTGEDPELFKERWEKLFNEFCDSEKADPSKVSELYDTMKYDALHNRQFLEWAFTPSQTIIDELFKEEAIVANNSAPESEKSDEPVQKVNRHDSTLSLAGSEKHSFAQKMGFRRKSVLSMPPTTPPLMSYEQDASYFKLYSGSGDTKSKQDKRLGRLRELYRYSKILFDYVGPQEYGISDHEKLEIGLLTSLPLLREIVQDLEELQASDAAKTFVYLTKEVSPISNVLFMPGWVLTKV
jgi:inositol-hexakisphosphate/diphosphoinositol-pentakisphosphate 1-kinase